MKNKLYKLFIILLAVPLLSFGQATLQNLPFSPNGTVHCQKQVGNTLYMGGDFTSVDVNTGALAGLNLSTTVAPMQLPFVNGTVNTIVSDGAGGYLIGGSFNSVGGQSRQNFARITAAMTVHPLNIRFNNTITKIVVHNGIAYAVGGFTNVVLNNVNFSRNLAAAINLSNGTLNNWSANVSNGYLYDAALNGTQLYLGGYFILNGERRVIAGYNLSAGGALIGNFKPIITQNGNPSGAFVYSLIIANNRIYYGGFFNRSNNVTCFNIAAINLSTNTNALLNISLNSSVRALAWNNNLLYVGGDFTVVNNVSRPRLFAYNTLVNSIFNSWAPSPNGTVRSLGIINNNLWVSGSFATISSNARSMFATYILNPTNINVPPIFNVGFNPSPNNLVQTILPVNNSTWIAGGSFNKISAAVRSGALAINLLNNSLTNFSPDVNGSVRAIEVVGSNVFLGGNFTRVNNNIVSNFAVVNANSGQSNNLYRASFNSTVLSLLAGGSQLYVGGQFTNFTVFAGNTASNRNQNALVSLGLGASSLILNTGFNANILGSSQYVKTIKFFNGQLYIGGSFTSPRNALAIINQSNGGALPFNANIIGSSSFVNDFTLTPQNTLAIGGNIQNVNGNFTYNLAFVNPINGGFVRSNNSGGTFASGMNNIITGLVPGNFNDIMYVNNSGLYRTQNNTGATASAYGLGGAKNCLTKIGTRYLIGGNFAYFNPNLGATYFNLLALDFIPPMAPTVTANNISFTNITTNSMRVNWNNGNGNARILMVRELSMGSGHPSDFTNYSQNNNYGGGSNIGGAFVMYNGTLNGTFIYNLKPGTRYDVKVVEYNGSGMTSVYASNFALGSQTTNPILPPTIGSGSVFANNITKNSMWLNFSAGNGNGRLVIAREGAPVNVAPSADILYSPSSTFGFGSHLGSGNFVVARTAGNTTPLNGLKPGTNYYFSVYEYNNYGSFMWRYNTTQVSSNNASTFAIAQEPTVPATNIQVSNNGGGSVKVRWTNGNGSRRILLAAPGAYNGINAINTIDGQGYLPNAFFNSNNPFPGTVTVNNFGSLLSNRVVYNGTLDSTIVFGLNSNTTYNFIVVEYNTLGASTENYLQNAWATTFFTTPALVVPPTIQANNLRAIASSNNQMRLSWNNGNGSRRIVIGKKGSPVNFIPVTNVNYAANTNFGIGTNLNNGNFVLYNGADNNILINNLEAYTDYHFSVFEYNLDYNHYTNQNEIRYLPLAAQGIGKTKPANWPRVAGGSGTDAAGGVATDADGNVFTAGAFKGTNNNFFGITQISGASAQAFLSKHNSAGVLQWIQTAGGGGDDAASMVTMDNSGNAYIVGSFQNTASFSNTLVTSNGSDDAYIAKYNNNGVLQWVRTMGGTGQDVAFWAKTDGNGDVVVTGYFHGTPSFSNSTQTLVSSGNSDIWIAKYNGSTGNLIWAVGAGGNSFDYGHSVTIGQNNSVIVAGEFKTTANFGSNQLTTNTNESRGFVAKLNNSGAWQWVIGMGNKSKALGITSDQNDNYYVVGGFTDSAYFNGQPFKSNGLNDAYISRVNTNGNIQWTNQIGGLSEDGASGVSIASDGVIHLVGTFADTCRFNASTTLSSAGGHDIFTAAFTNNGLLTQARRFGGPLEDKARAIHAVNSSNIYLCGYFTGSADFGGFVMDATPSTSSSLPEWDLFVHNIGSTYSPPSANNDLIAWYRFNNSLNDFSGNNFNGTSNGSPVYINNRLNTPNNALSFNGTTSRVSATVTKPEYNNLSEFTYTSWVRLNSYNASGYNFLLDKVSTIDGTHYLFAYVLTGGQIVFDLFDAGQNYCGYFYSNMGAISLNNWTHIGLSFKAGNAIKLYVNGAEVSSQYSGTLSGLMSFNNRELNLGTYKDGSSYIYHLNGAMDDVRLFKRALTQQEINDIRNANSANSAPPMENKNSNLVEDEPSVLYPNPNTGRFNLAINYSTEKTLSFRILDLSGKIILEEDASTFEKGLNTKKFELNAFNKGYYILQVLENNRILENHKVIINE